MLTVLEHAAFISTRSFHKFSSYTLFATSFYIIRAPAAGDERMPLSEPLNITVRGAVSAQEKTLTRFGTISITKALAPAIDVAKNGFMISTSLAEDMAGTTPRRNDAGKAICCNQSTQDLFARGDITCTITCTTATAQRHGRRDHHAGLSDQINHILTGALQGRRHQ